MTLIQCAECDHSISSAATSCPHCGFPLTSSAATQADTALRWPWFRFGVFCFFLSFVLFGLQMVLQALGAIDWDNEVLATFATILFVVVGMPLCVIGLLDRYVLRRSRLEAPFRWLNWSNGCLFLSGILLVVGSIALAGAEGGGDIGRARPPESVKLRTHASTDGLFELSLPEHWQAQQDFDRPSELQATSSRGIIYARAFSKTQLADLTLEQWGHISRDAALKQWKTTDVGTPTQQVVNGAQAIQWRVRSNVDQPMVLLLTVLETPTNFYQIQITSPENLYEQQSPEMKAIVESFRERNPTKM